MFIAIAIHHAVPQHTAEFVAFVHKVIDATSGAPGLIEFKACRDPSNGFLAGYSRWESRQAFEAALPAITSLGPLRNPEWATKPDELMTLVEA